MRLYARTTVIYIPILKRLRYLGTLKAYVSTFSNGSGKLEVEVDAWVEEMDDEDEMEGEAGPKRSMRSTPTPARWPLPVPVTPTKGSKRMAMGTPTPTSHHQSVAHPTLAANSVLKQIRAAKVERKM